MEEFESILDFIKPWFISKLLVTRECDQGIAKIEIEITNEKETKGIVLKGFNDFDACSSLLEADRVIISREVNSQRQYGTIRIECFSDDGYSSYWCDEWEPK